MADLKLSGGEDYIPSAEIMRRIGEMGDRFSERYASDEELVILTVLQGGARFASHLGEQIKHPRVTEAFTRLGCPDGLQQSKPSILAEVSSVHVKGKAVLVVDTLERTRASMAMLLPRILDHRPSRLDYTALVNNVESPKVTEELDCGEVDYGFEIPDRFVLGFGLDWDGLYRNMRHITAARNIGGDEPGSEIWVPIIDKEPAKANIIRPQFPNAAIAFSVAGV